MAEETMVKETLTEMMIESGKELIRTLDNYKLLINAAYWLYITDQNNWRLILVSYEVNNLGPKNIYKKIQSILSKNKDIIHLELTDISVVGPDDFISTLLHSAISTGKTDISGIRFSKNTINGFFIEDVYIYRMS